jgi:hypothetical protein
LLERIKMAYRGILGGVELPVCRSLPVLLLYLSQLLYQPLPVKNVIFFLQFLVFFGL